MTFLTSNHFSSSSHQTALYPSLFSVPYLQISELESRASAVSLRRNTVERIRPRIFFFVFVVFFLGLSFRVLPRGLLCFVFDFAERS